MLALPEISPDIPELSFGCLRFDALVLHQIEPLHGCFCPFPLSLDSAELSFERHGRGCSPTLFVELTHHLLRSFFDAWCLTKHALS